MNKKLYKKLCDNFGKEINVDVYELYKEELEGYDNLLVEQAIRQIIVNDKYMPNLARIIEIIKTFPRLELTEDQKIDRWGKEGIIPKWLMQEIKYEEVNQKELEQLEREMEIFI